MLSPNHWAARRVSKCRVLIWFGNEREDGGVCSLNLEIIDLGGGEFKDQKKLHRSRHFHTHLSCAKPHEAGRTGTIVTHILTIEKQRVSDSLGPQAPRRASLKSSLTALVVSTVLGRAQPRSQRLFWILPWGWGWGLPSQWIPNSCQPCIAGVPVAGTHLLPCVSEL